MKTMLENSLSNITQEVPNKAVYTKDQISLATIQWGRKCSAESPLLLHIERQSVINMFCFCRLLSVRVLSNDAVHAKNSTFLGTLALQILFNGELALMEPLKTQ